MAVVNDTAYFQEPIEEANRLWVGNIFHTENSKLKLTVIVDGQADGKAPRIEVHNPTGKSITATITSPQNTPLFGGTSFKVTVAAGSSQTRDL